MLLLNNETLMNAIRDRMKEALKEPAKESTERVLRDAFWRTSQTKTSSPTYDRRAHGRT